MAVSFYVKWPALHCTTIAGPKFDSSSTLKLISYHSRLNSGTVDRTVTSNNQRSAVQSRTLTNFIGTTLYRTLVCKENNTYGKGTLE